MDFFNRNYVHICFDIHALFPVEYLMHLQNRKNDIAIVTTTTVPKGSAIAMYIMLLIHLILYMEFIENISAGKI